MCYTTAFAADPVGIHDLFVAALQVLNCIARLLTMEDRYNYPLSMFSKLSEATVDVCIHVYACFMVVDDQQEELEHIKYYANAVLHKYGSSVDHVKAHLGYVIGTLSAMCHSYHLQASIQRVLGYCCGIFP